MTEADSAWQKRCAARVRLHLSVRPEIGCQRVTMKFRDPVKRRE